jgi:hypothetical protein
VSASSEEPAFDCFGRDCSGRCSEVFCSCWCCMCMDYNTNWRQQSMVIWVGYWTSSCYCLLPPSRTFAAPVCSWYILVSEIMRMGDKMRKIAPYISLALPSQIRQAAYVMPSGLPSYFSGHDLMEREKGSHHL